jgi:ArsR family transcriptional regulator, arsenate/arsenite/antimonite-responsive transcriptional repressor
MTILLESKSVDGLQGSEYIDICQCVLYHGGMPRVVLEVPERVKGCCVQLAPPLPEEVADDFAEIYKALADPTRVQMVHMLKAASGPVCVCDFTAAFDLGQPTVSHHLGKLKAAGLVRSFKRGVWAFYSLREDIPDAAKQVIRSIP